MNTPTNIATSFESVDYLDKYNSIQFSLGQGCKLCQRAENVVRCFEVIFVMGLSPVQSAPLPDPNLAKKMLVDPKKTPCSYEF